MIDIHHHLIYGVDDGAPDLQTSLAMAREAVAEGVTRIVCTPHSSDEYPYQAILVADRFAELRNLLKGEIELSLGCDFHMNLVNVNAACADPLLYSIDRKGYLLIEFPDVIIPPGIDDALFALRSAGYRLIVTHPERYLAVHSQPDLIAKWLRSECLMQVTARSLYGGFGPVAEAISNELLRRNWIHFIASDAHNPTRRPPHLKHAYEYVSQRVGVETAQRLFDTNPQAAVEGAVLGSQPEPIGLYEERPLKFKRYLSRRGQGPNEPVREAASPRGFWRRLLG